MTSLIVTTADYATSKSQQLTIPYINPIVSDSNLLTFAQKTAALSKDSYVKADRVDKHPLD